MAKGKKRSPAEITEALLAAVDDARTNGRAGRTVQHIADQYGVNVASLRTKLSIAGLRGDNINPNVGFKSKADNIEPATDNPDSNPSSLCNPFIINGKSELSSKSVENRGNDGVTLSPISPPNTGGEIGPKSPVNEDEAAISAVKKEVLTECRRLLREARRMTEIKSVRDYKTIADLALSMLGDNGKASGAGKQLIQVNILADSGSRSPKSIAAIEAKAGPISENPNETVTIEAESVTL